MIPSLEVRDRETAPSAGTRREGRTFALTLAGGFSFVALIARWRGAETVMAVAAILAGISLLSALLIPGKLEPIRRRWMKAGEAIGRVTTPVLMAIVYYLILTPTGLVRRLVVRRAAANDSYWHQRSPLPPRTRMERQF